MEPEYSGEEIEVAAKKLKNSRAVGRDEVNVELKRCGCNELYEQTASLLHVTSETGQYPEDIRRDILNSLAKPLKQNERVNVMPIILLSVLCKVITVTLIDRC